jgi:hypothetical protein
MMHREVHEVHESHTHDDPHYVEPVSHGHSGGYLTGSMAWVIAMVLIVVFALIVIFALFASI